MKAWIMASFESIVFSDQISSLPMMIIPLYKYAARLVIMIFPDWSSDFARTMVDRQGLSAELGRRKMARLGLGVFISAWQYYHRPVLPKFGYNTFRLRLIGPIGIWRWTKRGHIQQNRYRITTRGRINPNLVFSLCVVTRLTAEGENSANLI